MKIAIMGTGGVGGYFGGLLARGGHQVTFIARGAHLAAIQKNGLRVESQLDGDFTAQGSATSDPASAWHLARRLAGPDDLVCVTGSFFIAAEIRELVLDQPQAEPGLRPAGDSRIA